MKIEKPNIKVKMVRWELTPIFTEVYIEEDELKLLSEINDRDELYETLEDILGNDEYIYTSEGTDYSSYDWNGELKKFYIPTNEHSIYLTSLITIDDIPVSKYIDERVNEEIEDLKKEQNSLKVEDIKSIIRDKKIEEILKI